MSILYFIYVNLFEKMKFFLIVILFLNLFYYDINFQRVTIML